jgi:hypothetical protein
MTLVGVFLSTGYWRIAEKTMERLEGTKHPDTYSFLWYDTENVLAGLVWPVFYPLWVIWKAASKVWKIPGWTWALLLRFIERGKV